MALDINFLRRILEEKLTRRRQLRSVWALAIFSVVFLLAVLYVFYVKPPSDFPVQTVVTVEQGAGLNQIAQTLKGQHVIKSPFLFRAVVMFLSGQSAAQAGDYAFSESENVFLVARRVASGDFRLTPIKVTFPEGTTVAQMALILEGQMPHFNPVAFEKVAKSQEGFLFPDTYFFLPNMEIADIIKSLQDNFSKKIQTIDTSIKTFKKPVKDVVIMASILEAEARTTETRRVISGILWKRMSLGMPLQVDAPFQYSIGKNTFQLTTEDLKKDSPYNTYTRKGLPPGPINNPGIDSLQAAVTPISSPYFFYLSDIHGEMHYAKTFAEHVVNKEKYLK